MICLVISTASNLSKFDANSNAQMIASIAIILDTDRFIPEGELFERVPEFA